MKRCLAGPIVLYSMVFASGLAAAEQTTADDFLTLYAAEEQEVEGATRVATPISQVAENVTIITAQEIDRMNARNVDDVLNRVAGIYVNYSGLDFNHNSDIYIQGSSWEHVAVLLDGIRLTKASAEIAWVNLIPVHTIERIEVIKGAASSTWGSALGGIINIITKEAAASSRPQANLVASYGEKGSHDVAAELAGRAGRLHYYLHGGNQESDGLRDDRYFKNNTGYGKLGVELAQDTSLELSAFYSRPEYKDTHWPAADFYQELNDKNTFVSAYFDTLLVESLNLHAELFRFDNDYRAVRHTISRPETLIQDFFNDQESQGGALRLDYSLGNHRLVAGADYQRNEIQVTWKYRNGGLWDLYYPALAPMGDYFANDLLTEDVSGYYVNGTFVFDRLAVTPGLRWDHISTVSDELISPSLGTTYQFRPDTLLRASVSRGFRKPPVYYLEVDPLYSPTAVNPNLDPEKNWSYQVGLETTAIAALHVKTTLFYHDVENTWEWAPDWSIFRVNGDRSQRQGLEVEIATEPLFYTSLKANFTYTYSDLTKDRADHSSTANIILLFDHPDIVTAEFSGHYVKWGDFLADGSEAAFNKAMLWDLSINRRLYDSERFGARLFATVRNIFDGSQYTNERWPNAPRYCEAGVKLRF